MEDKHRISARLDLRAAQCPRHKPCPHGEEIRDPREAIMRLTSFLRTLKEKSALVCLGLDLIIWAGEWNHRLRPRGRRLPAVGVQREIQLLAARKWENRGTASDSGPFLFIALGEYDQPYAPADLGAHFPSFHG